MTYPRREKAVDLGCGTGTGTGLLSSIANSVVGVDTDGDNIKTAMRRFPGISFYKMDPSRTGFSDGEFDTAFMIMLLHEAYSDLLIAEACRIAREVVVIDYSRILYGLSGRLIRALEREKYDRYAEINLTLKFSQLGYSLNESRSVYFNFFFHVFTRGKTSKSNVVNLIQN